MQCADIGAAKTAAHAVVVCVVSSPPNWTAVLGPAVVALSALIAWFGIRNVREVARQRATLDFIEKVESTPHYRTLNQAFSRLRRSRGFLHLSDPQDEADRSDRQAVNDYLNHYELVAVGIRRNILDAAIYRKWMLSAFVRDWNAASPFVQRERWKWDPGAQTWRYHARLYENYQWAACLWSRDAVRLTPQSFPPPERPSGPGDETLPIT